MILSHHQHNWSQRVVALLMCLLGALPSFGQLLIPDTEVPQRILSEQSRVYLINCDPGEIIYERFGHTGIRIVDPTLLVDVTYHYGVFDYLQPHFVGRFVAGATDYSIGCWPWDLFIFDYKERHSTVHSQELNLTWEERNQLFLALEKNNQKRNRIYRYNFVFDNCATRPFDIIIKTLKYDFTIPYEQGIVDGSKVIPEIRRFNPNPEIKTHTRKEATYRNVIEEHLGNNTWWKFSIDIVIGKNADKPIGWQQLIAFPTYLKDIADQIIIVRKDGKETEAYPLVCKNEALLDYPSAQLPDDGIMNPIVVCSALLVLIFLITFLGWKKKRHCLWVDNLLFLMYGLSGCLVFFLMFFSQHPLVDSNLNLLWLNPLQLVFAIMLLFKKWRKSLNYYLLFNTMLLLVAIVLWGFGPQVMHPAFLPLMVAMLIRSLYYIMYQTKLQDEK